ncbi:MAG: hypothetical protein M3447_11255 [Acidobacteriota bacterium]|nr:hypothetical protein [Acidobacteriota bacterium]
MNHARSIATAIKNITGVTIEEAEALTIKHQALISGAVIFPNAERIIQAEAQGFEAFKCPVTEAPETPLPDIPATDNLRPYVKLGSQLVPLNSEKEVKQMIKQGFTIIEK